MKSTRKSRASKSRKERREHPRLTLSASVLYRVDKFPSPTKMIRFLDSMRRAAGLDISNGGVCLISRQLLLPETILSLHLPRNSLRKSQHVKAQVVWIHEIKEGKFRVGLRFL